MKIDLSDYTEVCSKKQIKDPVATFSTSGNIGFNTACQEEYGIKGGDLMCETRNKQIVETRAYKPRVYKTPDERDGPKKTEKPSKRTNSKEEDGFTKIPTRREKTSSRAK
jgi:hypothetical protein